MNTSNSNTNTNPSSSWMWRSTNSEYGKWAQFGGRGGGTGSFPSSSSHHHQHGWSWGEGQGQGQVGQGTGGTNQDYGYYDQYYDNDASASSAYIHHEHLPTCPNYQNQQQDIRVEYGDEAAAKVLGGKPEFQVQYKKGSGRDLGMEETASGVGEIQQRTMMTSQSVTPQGQSTPTKMQMQAQVPKPIPKPVQPPASRIEMKPSTSCKVVSPSPFEVPPRPPPMASAAAASRPALDANDNKSSIPNVCEELKTVEKAASILGEEIPIPTLTAETAPQDTTSAPAVPASPLKIQPTTIPPAEIPAKWTGIDSVKYGRYTKPNRPSQIPYVQRREGSGDASPFYQPNACQGQDQDQAFNNYLHQIQNQKIPQASPQSQNPLQLCGRCIKCKNHLPEDNGPIVKSFNANSSPRCPSNAPRFRTNLDKMHHVGPQNAKSFRTPQYPYGQRRMM